MADMFLDHNISVTLDAFILPLSIMTALHLFSECVRACMLACVCVCACVCVFVFLCEIRKRSNVCLGCVCECER